MTSCSADGVPPVEQQEVGLGSGMGTGLSSMAANGLSYSVGPRTPFGIHGKPLVETASGLVVADEILVRFAAGVPDVDVLAAVEAAGGTVELQAPLSGYFLVRLPDAGAAVRDHALQFLRQDPRVMEAALNHVMTGATVADQAVDADLVSRQWNLWAMGIEPDEWNASAAGTTVAVLDTGIAYEDYSDSKGVYALAPTLAGVEFIAGYDFVNDDDHANDDQRHGTHVAGVIAASSGIAAIAPGVALMPVKVLDGNNSGTELGLAEGILFAASSGADAINMSLSFPPTYFPSFLLQTTVDYATSQGVVMVAAAGNHGEPIVCYPAAFRDVIAVGGSDLPDDFRVSQRHGDEWADIVGELRLAPYSNHSHRLDVLAPSGTITGDANGDGWPEAILAQTFSPGDPTDFHYYYYAGTSQAAAEVTGVVALVLAANPSLGPFQVRALLVENAKRLKDGGDCRDGHCQGDGKHRGGRDILSAEAGRGAVMAART
ncbi:MAG: S8 family serine peptidase, partial [Pseudomonadota bacterium]